MMTAIIGISLDVKILPDDAMPVPAPAPISPVGSDEML